MILHKIWWKKILYNTFYGHGIMNHNCNISINKWFCFHYCLTLQTIICLTSVSYISLSSKRIFKRNSCIRDIPLSLKSSSKITSCRYSGGDLFTTLWAVRNNGDHASLWNIITTLAFGRSFGYDILLHLKRIKYRKWNKVNHIYSEVELLWFSSCNIDKEEKS